MRILISNDDGIYSPGILALAEVAQQFGEDNPSPVGVRSHTNARRSKDSKPIG